MERMRHKSSKVINGTDVHSTSALDGFPAPPSPVPLGDIPKKMNFSNFGSDSRSFSSKAADEDKFLYCLGWRSSKRARGTSIKKLMADEMSIETEIKRRSPRVIAKSKGLDRLPLQQSSRRFQQKVSPESHSEKKSSVENYRKRGLPHGKRSSRSSSKDEQRFKDVCEVSEMLNMGSHRYLLQINADNKVNDAEMSFIEQKLVDARCLFTDRRVPKSQEFADTLEVLDSNQDLLLKYFEQPDSLLAKHLDDLQVSTFRSHCAHSEFVQTYDAHKYENVDMERKCGRSKMRLNYRKSHDHVDSGLPNNLHGKHAVFSSNSSYFQSRVRDQSAATPTRIVVLKPNLGKVKDAVKIVSSPCNPHDIIFDHLNHTDFSITRTEKAGIREKKNSPSIHISKRHSKEPREIASEFTEKMKNSLNGGSMTSSPSTFTGYVGACDFCGNESADESEVRRTKLSNNHSSLKSYVSKEATKRLSELWKLAHKSKEVEISGGGSTLAEMLAIPDKETLRPKFDCVIEGESIYENFSIGDRSSRCVEPLGISTRDGWKDGCVCNLTSSKSLPASSPTLGRPMSSCRKPFPGHSYMISSDASKGEKTRPKKGGDPKYGLWTPSKSGCRKSHCHCPTKEVTYESSPNMHTNQNKVQNSFGGSCLTDQDQDIVTDKLTSSLKTSISAPDSVENLECGNGGDHYECETKMSPGISSSVAAQAESETVEPSNSAQQERLARSSNECSSSSQSTLPGLESPSSIKEVDQPSPVSVLEPSLTDDLSSSSDCFESLSAKLRGLRVQLQLLKFESKSYAEGSVLMSSDEDGEEGSARNSDEGRSCGIKDNWESSYIVDILTYAGLDDVHLDSSILEWQSPGYSVNPLLFDELEKKYSKVTSCLRSERKLLFDRVNSALYDIYQQFMEPRPWVRSATKLASGFTTNVGKGRLLQMLANKERHGNKDTMGKLLAKEIEWLDLKDEIHVIGREMEKSLMNELIVDVIYTYDCKLL